MESTSPSTTTTRAQQASVSDAVHRLLRGEVASADVVAVAARAPQPFVAEVLRQHQHGHGPARNALAVLVEVSRRVALGADAENFAKACRTEGPMDPRTSRLVAQFESHARITGRALRRRDVPVPNDSVTSTSSVPSAVPSSSVALGGGGAGAPLHRVDHHQQQPRRPPRYATIAALRPATRVRRAALVLRQPSSTDVSVSLEDRQAALTSTDVGSRARARGAAAGFGRRMIPSHRDYIEQSPLPVTEQLLDEQVRTLKSFFKDFTSAKQQAGEDSADIALATNVLVKIMMDAYAERVPSLGGYSLLREVSYSFLGVFRQFVSGDWLCVRKHTYNIIATLAMHAQLIDRLDSFAGSTRAVEAEIAWLLRRVIEYQYLTVDHDDNLWLAALKCCFVVFSEPQTDWAALHIGALYSMMSVPTVSTAFPRAFEKLAAALAQHIERLATRHHSAASPASVASPSTAVSAAAAGPGPGAAAAADLDEARRHLLGGVGVVDLLAAAPTVKSAVHLVRGIGFLAGILRAPVTAGSSSERAWEVLEALGVPWAMHLVAGLPPGVGSQAAGGTTGLARELSQAVTSETEREHDVTRALGSMVTGLVDFIAAGQQLPLSVARAQVAEILSALPAMIHDDTDGELRRCGRLVVAFILRLHVTDNRQVAAAGAGVTDAAVAALKQPHAAVTIVRACARLQSAAFPAASRAALCAVATPLLDPASAGTSGRAFAPLLALFRALLETLSTIGPPSLLTGDIASMVLSSAVTVSAELFDSGSALNVSVDSGCGPEQQHILWALYWALRRFTSTVRAIRSARHVVLALIVAHDPSLSWTWGGRSGVDLWHDVLQDPHAPCCLLAAERIVQHAALTDYESYERVASTGQTQNPYIMARSMYSAILHARHQRQHRAAATPAAGPSAPPPQSAVGAVPAMPMVTIPSSSSAAAGSAAPGGASSVPPHSFSTPSVGPAVPAGVGPGGGGAAAPRSPVTVSPLPLRPKSRAV